MYYTCCSCSICIQLTRGCQQESFLLPVPSFSQHAGPGCSMQRPVSPLVEDAEGEEGEVEGAKRPTVAPTPSGSRPTRHPDSYYVRFLRQCYPSKNNKVPFLPKRRLESCLPPSYHKKKYLRRVPKHIKVGDVLFGSNIFFICNIEKGMFSI